MTTFRDFVVRHLKPWHDFCKICFVNDVSFTNTLSGTGKIIVDGLLKYRGPASCLQLPEWTKHFAEEARLGFKDRLGRHLTEIYARCEQIPISKEFPEFAACGIDECADWCDPFTTSGYPLASIDECITHLHEVHGINDAEIAHIIHSRERGGHVRLSESPHKLTYGSETPQRRGRKRRLEETTDDIQESKRNRQ